MKRTKISPTMAAQIMSDIASGLSYVVTAAKYGVSATTITNIRKRMDVSYESPRLQPCGTNAAYARHIRKDEVPCIFCTKAHANYELARIGRDSRPKSLQPCGTNAAYMRHRRNGQEPCPECTSAHSRYNYLGRY